MASNGSSTRAGLGAVPAALVLAFLVSSGSAAADGTLLTRNLIIHYGDGYGPIATSLAGVADPAAESVAAFLSVDPRNLSVELVSRPGFGLAASAFGGNVSVGIPPAPSALSLEWTPRQLGYVMAHELTHVLLGRALPNASVGVPDAFPAWLEEGLANYLGGLQWPSVNRTSRGLMAYLMNASPVADIDTLFSPGPYVGTMGYALITYLIETGGSSAFRGFLSDLKGLPSCCTATQTGDALSRAYGVGSAALTALWHTWLRDEYARDAFVAGASFPTLTAWGTDVDGPKSPGAWRGDRIAFTLEGPGGIGEVCVSPANGSMGRCGPALPQPFADPRISPEGDRVLLTAYEAGGFGLALWTLSNDTLVPLTDGTDVDVAGSWSPDGADVLFSSTRSGNFDVWRLHLPTMTFEALTTDPSDEFSPAVSPDGTRIAYVSNRSGPYTVYVSDASGRETRPLWPDGPDLRSPAWSPDGTKVVAAVAAPDGTGIAEMGVTFPGHAVLVDLTSGVDRSGRAPWAGFPVYSPDGRRILFSSGDELSLTDAVLRPAGTSPLPAIGAMALAIVALVALFVALRRRRRGSS